MKVLKSKKLLLALLALVFILMISAFGLSFNKKAGAAILDGDGYSAPIELGGKQIQVNKPSMGWGVPKMPVYLYVEGEPVDNDLFTGKLISINSNNDYSVAVECKGLNDPDEDIYYVDYTTISSMSSGEYVLRVTFTEIDSGISKYLQVDFGIKHQDEEKLDGKITLNNIELQFMKPMDLNQFVNSCIIPNLTIEPEDADYDRSGLIIEIKSEDSDRFVSLGSTPSMEGRYIIRVSLPATENYKTVSATARLIIYSNSVIVVRLDEIGGISYGVSKPQVIIYVNGLSYYYFYDITGNDNLVNVGENEYRVALEYRNINDADEDQYYYEYDNLDTRQSGEYILRVRLFTTNDEIVDEATISFEIAEEGEKAIGNINVSIIGWEFGKYDAEVNKLIIEILGNADYNINNAIIDYTMKGADGVYNQVTSPVNAGDYKVRVSFDETNSYKGVSKEVDFTIAKAQAVSPGTLPSNLTAKTGQTLADITLPAGYSWKNSVTSVGGVGTRMFDAEYNPDPLNYNSVDVQLSITVSDEPSSSGLNPTQISLMVGAIALVVLGAVLMIIFIARRKRQKQG